jgi:hypothetical protein
MMTCDIGVVWRVRHTDRGVRIFDAQRTRTLPGALCNDLDVIIPISHYRREIVAFELEAKSLFAGVPKTGDWEFVMGHGPLGNTMFSGGSSTNA